MILRERKAQRSELAHESGARFLEIGNNDAHCCKGDRDHLQRIVRGTETIEENTMQITMSQIITLTLHAFIAFKDLRTWCFHHR